MTRLGVIIVASACLGDPVGPGLLTVSLVDGTIDSVLVGAPGTLLPSPVRLRVTDGRGSPIPGATLAWETIGSSAQVFGASTQTNLAGEAVAGWQLGTNAAEEQQLRVAVHTTRKETEVVLRARAVPSVVAQLRLALDTPAVVRLGDTLPAPVVAIDPFGNEFSAPDVVLSVDDTAMGTVRGSTLVGGPRRGRTMVQVSSHGRQAAFALDVKQFVSVIATALDTLRFNSLGAELPVGYEVRDDRGKTIWDTMAALSVADTQVVSITDGRVRSVADGQTVLRLALGAASKTVTVQVQQRAVRVELATDTLRFTALGDTLAWTATAFDSLGFPVTGGDIDSLTVTPAGIVEVVDATTFTAVANGVAQVSFTAAGVPARLSVVVSQVPHSVAATVNYPKPILTLPVGASVPLDCTVYDRNGREISVEPIVTSLAGTMSSGACSQVTVRFSGFDTLLVETGSIIAAVPVVVAAAPVVDGPLGNPIVFDSLLPRHYRWTPSARRNSAGLIELYLTQYEYPSDTLPHPRGDLYRFVSTDGMNFQYDGVALRRGDDPCAPDGSGIENMVIAPRSDGPGWRMFYAAGSWGCYGWQVFSAVSTDERVWVKESGVRLSNGGELFSPPDPPSGVPWPVGEGMVIDRLTDGRWRMITASFEHVLYPAPDAHWQISEWLSDDQVSWIYSGVILGTSQMPSEAQGSVYSPSIVEVVPGVYRMFFTGDNRRLSSQPRSALWSAVSTDKRTWQIEGELLGAPGVDVYYATTVDDKVFFLSNTMGAWSPVARVATVSMP